MIMRQGQQLLLPANPLFVWGSLMAALFLNMLQNMGLWGRATWAPDLLAVVLVFWTVHQPLRVSIVAAFVFGVLMDVHQGSLLGQHALAYTVLSFLAIALHRRLLWFTVPSQAAQVLPLFVVSHAVELSARLLAGGSFPGWAVLAAPLLEAALWPLATVLLLMPQRRAPDPDAHRPL
jgi:rod shape-determining protein MreD